MLNTTAFVLGLALSDIRGYKMEAVEACCPQILINRMTTSPGLSECERRNPETHHNTPVEDESSFTSGTIPKTNTCAKRDRHCGESIRRAPPKILCKGVKKVGGSRTDVAGTILKRSKTHWTLPGSSNLILFH